MIKKGTDANGNLVITLDKPYTFRTPRGRDLAAIESFTKDTDRGNTEIMAATLAALSLDTIDYDGFLDLPAETMVDLGVTVMGSFRVFHNETV